ncbi:MULTISPECIES: hypothetical protein [Halomonadaceae]|uniref:hypothetical protein n=1 Tax=Halomonadaceae TaxID=28256 RepID=UPI00159A3906|nr:MULTISPECIES: hypothetical protein [Halomonas]QJQ94151.1 hypothetical protein HIO72_01830 [Halomonas sp. PA5]
MHKHVEWDDPGRDSVSAHFAHHPHQHAEPGPGDILSARFKGKVVRIKVAAHVDGTSIGDVVAMIDPDDGARIKSHDKLALGDTVRLPNESRAFEPRGKSEESDDNDDDR